jgi:bifunctional NMN adenylyltransferase/nudix hydrolase
VEGGISATKIREQLLDQASTDLLTKYCSPIVREYVLSWMKLSAATQLVEEYAFIKAYKNRWATAPFPPTFVTTDAVVVALGHVLVIKRGRHPGKGLYALPGGFLDQTETIQNGCIRELREETNIDTSKRILENSIRDEHVFDHPLRDPRGRTITHAYLFDIDVPRLPAVDAADDASEAVWIPLQDLESIEDKFFNDHAQIIKYFLNRMR